MACGAAGIRDATIVELQEALIAGRLTSRELVLCYLERIATFDRCQDGLNAVLELNPDALFIADALDAERGRGHVRGPLHGIPVMLKDTINTADKMHTSAGSLALADNLAPYDAHVVSRLRAAGAIMLGKTNMTEFANFMGENMPGGYSSRGGQVLSPFNRDRNPGGSSAGSAAAVAAGLCAAALGTENYGSIIYPAMYNGIVGLKPTMGLVSRHGNVPTTNTLDVIGPMTRSVADAALVLAAMAGRDENDPATWAQGEGLPVDDARALDPDGLRGARIGVHRPTWDVLEGAKAAAFGALRAALEDAGATLVDVEDVGTLIAESDINPIFFCECKACLNAYLATLFPNLTCTSLQEVIAFNDRHAERALRYGQPILREVQDETWGTLTAPAYLDALAKRERAIAALDGLFEAQRVDVLLCTQPEFVAPTTGFPSLTLPIGMGEDRMPLGAYWIARRYDEATLLRIAHGAEQRLGVRCVPEMISAT